VRKRGGGEGRGGEGRRGSKKKTIISKNCDLTTAIVETPKKIASRVMKSAI
jgi:hypothetical protein